MSLEFIKHDRTVTMDDQQKYGKYATHDIKVPVLLAYELGQIPDKNGTLVNVNKKFMEETMEITNKQIRNRHNSPFARIKSWLSKPVEEVEAIPIIKNHKTDDVDGVVGYSKGMLYMEEIEGKMGLFVNGIIQDPEAKKKVENKLLRATSFGTRADGSIKEISFVINPAIPHGGPVFSEQEPKKVELSEKQIELSEQISALQLQEVELSEVIIPNHIVLARLIRTGRLQPWKYEGLIKTKNKEALELMESSTVGSDLGTMIGTFKPPMDIGHSSEALINDVVNKYKKKRDKLSGKKVEKEESKAPVKSAHTDPMIMHSISLQEMRKKELKNILELTEHSPEIAAKYIKVELGEKIDSPKYQDTYLNDYLKQSKELKEKINNLTIQLGELE